MKKTAALLFAILVLFSLSACGSNSNATSPQKAETPQQASAPEATPEPSDTISANGYTIKIVAVHRTKDSNGNTIAAVELQFTNDNSAPASFMQAGQAKLYQNGVQMTSSEMFLERNYDWDSYYTEVKDGGTITVFRAMPLQNGEDPVEVSVDLIDTSKGKFLASTTYKMDLTD